MRLHPDMEKWWSKHGDHLLVGLFFSPSWSKDQFSPYRILLLSHIIPFFDDIPVLWWNWYGSKLPSPRIGVFTLKDLNLWSLRSLIWLIHIFMVLDQIPSIFWSPRSISLGYQFAYYDDIPTCCLRVILSYLYINIHLWFILKSHIIPLLLMIFPHHIPILWWITY